MIDIGNSIADPALRNRIDNTLWELRTEIAERPAWA